MINIDLYKGLQYSEIKVAILSRDSDIKVAAAGGFICRAPIGTMTAARRLYETLVQNRGCSRILFRCTEI
jgi:hypothetical protein